MILADGIIVLNVILFKKKQKKKTYKESGLMCFHIFKHVRQHTLHETQLGIPSLNCNENGKVFSSFGSFCSRLRVCAGTQERL